MRVGDHARAIGSVGRRHRQGNVSPRQVLWRRPDHGALRHLEALGLDPLDVPSWHRVDDIIVRGPNGREVELPLPRRQGQFAVVARRFDLDNALVKRARGAGHDPRRSRLPHR